MFQTFSRPYSQSHNDNMWHEYSWKGGGGRAVYTFTQSKVQQQCFIWVQFSPVTFRQMHMDTRRNTTRTCTELSAQAATGLLCNSVIRKLIMNTHRHSCQEETSQNSYIWTSGYWWKMCAKHAHILKLELWEISQRNVKRSTQVMPRHICLSAGDQVHYHYINSICLPCLPTHFK